ncbi:IucA/IucC family protein [Photobacterium aphoticum]|uniref:Siderophore biosynthesis protein n=1 Tax=Photobacterium aphoticum TaxID=754436 RepID=A0A0J1JCH6_9GAMM|nr:IucA/IucC family protein [Photobacterium aphoticum]KLU99296.1 hypothetical protein ABT58_18340 [Photobacterium aphoticum]
MINTPATGDSTEHISLSQQASALAEYASLQAFLNAYLREVAGAQWYAGKETENETTRVLPCLKGHPAVEAVVVITLAEGKGELAIAVSYRSKVGCHRFVASWFRQHPLCWSSVSPLRVMHLLSRSLYAQRGKAWGEDPREYELQARLQESHRLMSLYLVSALQRPQPVRQFLVAEQALYVGHWLHPTPKSRQGMLDHHHATYAPECGGCFQLHYFRVHASLISQRSALTVTAEEMLSTALETERLARPGYVVLPIHPLQAQWLLHQEALIPWFAQGMIVDLGRTGPSFSATSSVRSLYHPDLPWMLKFSLPVKITNSLRVNKRHELDAGVVMANLSRKLPFFADHPTFQLVTDPAYITVDLPGQPESGFEVIVRENPFRHGLEEETVTVAALTQAPLPGQDSMLKQLIDTLTTVSCPAAVAASKWFARYWDCAIAPMIRLYDEHGIALEAHQQNSVVTFEQGYPKTYYFRDNQGFYLSAAYRDELTAFEADTGMVHDLYFDDAMIRDRFTYYLFVNHLFAIIGRLGADGLQQEAVLLAFVRQRLLQLLGEMKGAGRPFLQGLLARPSWPFKANLLTRVEDIDELLTDNEQAVYAWMPNPLLAVSDEEESHALAEYV